jgi:predicted RNase H-like HicB family nuclease
MEYIAVIIKGETRYVAHAPDSPGCIAACETREEVLARIKDAIEFHIEGLVEAGEPVQSPSSVSEIIQVNAA